MSLLGSKLVVAMAMVEFFVGLCKIVITNRKDTCLSDL